MLVCSQARRCLLRGFELFIFHFAYVHVCGETKKNWSPSRTDCGFWTFVWTDVCRAFWRTPLCCTEVDFCLSRTAVSAAVVVGDSLMATSDFRIAMICVKSHFVHRRTGRTAARLRGDRLRLSFVCQMVDFGECFHYPCPGLAVACLGFANRNLYVSRWRTSADSDYSGTLLRAQTNSAS